MRSTPYRGVQERRIESSSHTALRLNFIVFFSNTWLFICYGFHRNRVANRSSISRKKAHLSPLLRSWSIGSVQFEQFPCLQAFFRSLAPNSTRKQRCGNLQNSAPRKMTHTRCANQYGKRLKSSLGPGLSLGRRHSNRIKSTLSRQGETWQYELKN